MKAGVVKAGVVKAARGLSVADVPTYQLSGWKHGHHCVQWHDAEGDGVEDKLWLYHQAC